LIVVKGYKDKFINESFSDVEKKTYIKS